MREHKLTLQGGAQGELRVSAAVLSEVLDALQEGARRAARFAVEGESVRNGPRPAWLDAACDIVVTGLRPGSTVIALEAPTLGEADATRFGADQQRALFEESDPGFGEQTAIDLFGHVLGSVLDRRRDDVIADRALLDICVRFASSAGESATGVRLEGLYGRRAALTITREHVSQIALLRDETPPPQAARVAGVLDTISASRTDVVLVLKDGARVPARMDDHDLGARRELIGEEVVVSGMAHYRPSGQLLRIDVESIGKPGVGDRLFERTPVAHRRLAGQRPVAQDGSSGVSAFFNTWPGDESEEELLEALQAIG